MDKDVEKQDAGRLRSIGHGNEQNTSQEEELRKEAAEVRERAWRIYKRWEPIAERSTGLTWGD